MRYRAQRYPTRYPVKLKVGAVWFKATATSVSESGICLSVDASVTVGENVLIECPVGSFEAVVRWGTENKIGLRFAKAIPSADLSRLRYGLQVSGHARKPNISVGFSEMR